MNLLAITIVCMVALANEMPRTESISEGHAMREKDTPNSQLSHATFGGGCFWCMEAVFSRVKGVHTVVSGYSGGHVENPTYGQVTAGTTGHAEVVQITYDPATISYTELLEVFFRVHDPTTLNRQGADIGTQYRSVVFYHNKNQKETAKAVTERLEKEGIWDDPLVTEVSAIDTFYKAEEYHQNYFARNPDQAYCQMVILPKVEKFKKLFKDLVDTP